MIKHRTAGFSRGLALAAVVAALGGCAQLPGAATEPTGTPAALAGADAAYDAGEWAAAARAYRRHLSAAPDDARAWYRLGNAEARRGELTAAEAAYRESLQRDPAGARARHNLGLVQLQLGHRNLLAARRELPADDAVAAETMRYLACLTAVFRGRPSSPACRLQNDTEDRP